MSVDDMPCARNQIMLRAITRSWIERWNYCSRLRRIRAIPATEHEVILAKYYVDWSSEFCRRCNDATEVEKLANCVGLFVGKLIIEDYKASARRNVPSSWKFTFRIKVRVAEKSELNALLSGLGQIPIINALELP